MPSGTKLSTEQRLAICQLLEQRDTTGKRLLTHQAIAERLGLRRETVGQVVEEAAIEWGKIMRWQRPPGSF